MKLPIILAALATFNASVCSAEIKLPSASPELLLGAWQVDFESTWNKSRDAFMKDTMRGDGAYPVDAKQKAAIVKAEMARLFAAGTGTFGADGAASMTLGGQTMEGNYEVKSRDGNKLEIGLENLLRAKAYQVVFLAEDTAMLALKDKFPLRIVLHRKGGSKRANPGQLKTEEEDETWYRRYQELADAEQERKRLTEEKWRMQELAHKKRKEADKERERLEEEKRRLRELAYEKQIEAEKERLRLEEEKRRMSELAYQKEVEAENERQRLEREKRLMAYDKEVAAEKERSRLEEEKWRLRELAFEKEVAAKKGRRRLEEQKMGMHELADLFQRFYSEEDKYPDTLLDLKQRARQVALFAFRGQHAFEDFVERLEYHGKGSESARILVATERGAGEGDCRLVILSGFRVDSMTEEAYQEALKTQQGG